MVTSTSSVSPIVPEPQEVTDVFPPVIQIYSFAEDPNHTIIPVQPLDLDYMDDTTARPILLAQLELPRLAPRVIVSSFDIRPDPAFAPQKTRVPNLRSTKPFTQDPEKGVIVLDLHVLEAPENVNGAGGHFGATPNVGFEMFILRETLVGLAREGEERLREVREENMGEGNQPWRVEIGLRWEDWGVKGCRLMDISMRRRQWVSMVSYDRAKLMWNLQVCTCSGYRFAALVPSVPVAREMADLGDEMDHPPTDRMDIRIIDFSPYTHRRPLTSSKNDETTRVTLHRSPTVLSKGRVWKEDVVSELAYQEVFAHWGVRGNGIMVDEERLIVVAVSVCVEVLRSVLKRVDRREGGVMEIGVMLVRK
jgi:hypothetical protein